MTLQPVRTSDARSMATIFNLLKRAGAKGVLICTATRRYVSRFTTRGRASGKSVPPNHLLPVASTIDRQSSLREPLPGTRTMNFRGSYCSRRVLQVFILDCKREARRQQLVSLETPLITDFPFQGRLSCRSAVNY